MADYVFIQRTRLGRVIFTLRDATLELTAHVLGRTSTSNLELRTLSSDYDRVARRLPLRAIVPVLVVAAVCFAAYFALVQQNVVPSQFALYPAMFAVTFLWAGLRLLRRFDCFIFKNQWQKPVLVIVREPEQAAECEAFVRELLDRIERVERGLPPATATAVMSSAGADPESRAELKWKICLGAGVFSTAIPLLALFDRSATFWTATLVLASPTCGLIAGIGAFAAKERLRYWAIPGVALCLVPFLFYR